MEIKKTDIGGTLTRERTVQRHYAISPRKPESGWRKHADRSGEKMLMGFADGKIRDAVLFEILAMKRTSSRHRHDSVEIQSGSDRRHFALPEAKPGTKVELRWAEFKPVPGVTEAKGIPFGEEGSSLTYLHKQAVLTNEDLAEVRLGDPFTWEINGKKIELYSVNLYFTKEAKEKLVKAGQPGKNQLLALLIDGRNTSTMYVNVADLSKFSQTVGSYEKPDAEGIAEGNPANDRGAEGSGVWP